MIRGYLALNVVTLRLWTRTSNVLPNFYLSSPPPSHALFLRGEECKVSSLHPYSYHPSDYVYITYMLAAPDIVFPQFHSHDIRYVPYTLM